jgi:hypothetical protein
VAGLFFLSPAPTRGRFPLTTLGIIREHAANALEWKPPIIFATDPSAVAKAMAMAGQADKKDRL